MINLGKWRLPVLLFVPAGVLAGLIQFNGVRLNYESESQLAYTGELKQLPSVVGVRVERSRAPGTVRLIGQGSTPSRAVRAAQTAAESLVKRSLDQKKNAI